MVFYKRRSWLKVASFLFEDSAPSASRDCLKAQAAATHPRAQPEQLGGWPWPQELASGWPKVEEFSLSTNRRRDEMEQLEPRVS